jgi:glycerophosphoryl diester phosphodiesterase
MKILSIGHRGAKGHYKENTARSISEAADMGIDIIEIDVALTQDNVFVLWHNNTVKPYLMQEEKEICDLKYNDLILEEICTLNKALGIMGNSMAYLDLKIPESKKEDMEYIEDYAKKLLKFLEDEGESMIILASFNKILMDKVRLEGTSGNYFLGYLYNLDEDVLDGQISDNFDLYIFDYRDKRLREYVRKLGNVFVYTVNEDDDMERMRELGVRGIVSDYPDKVEKIK